MVQRAKTSLGLLAQLIALKWAGLGKRGKILLVAFGVLAGLTAAQFGMCMLGACPASGPCGAASSPCSAAAADSDEPCPYSSQLEAAPVEEAPLEADTPPCHAR